MKKNIELNFLLHIIIFSIMFFMLYKYENYNVFNDFKNAIDNASEVMKEEIMYATVLMYSDANIASEDINLPIEEYKEENLIIVDNARYAMNYYMPALIVLLIIVLMNCEYYIYRHIKFSYNKMLCSKKKKVSHNKIKDMIRDEISFKYRKIFLPKSVPIVYVACTVINILIDFQNEIIERTIANLIFIGTIIITIYGIRLVINFFKTNNGIVRALFILLNILIGILYPQIYFVIGFFESIVNIRIVVRKINK